MSQTQQQPALGIGATPFAPTDDGTTPAATPPDHASPTSSAPGYPPRYTAAYHPTSAYPTPGYPFPTPTPTLRRRRPGWLAVAGAAAGAAVLASGLTAGVLQVFGEGTGGSATVGSLSSQSAQPGPVTGATSASPDWQKVAAAVEPAVVSVQVSGSVGSGEGSGVIVDRSGHVVTNNHVVSEVGQSAEITVVLSDGRSYTAEVVGTDPTTDLAVIKIKNAPGDLTPAALGDSSAVRAGQPVMAVGNPLGLSGTATTGIVSATDRPVTTSTASASGSSADATVTNAIQTDAAVNPGNSGGALVNGNGQVIGITSSIASLDASAGGQSGSIGLGFAIPVNEVRMVADQLIAKGTATHSYLGVSTRDDTVQDGSAQRQAAVIQQVVAGTPAASSGLQAGDAVVAVDGENVNGAQSLTAMIRERAAGARVKLTVLRDGTRRTVEVTLAVRGS